MKIKHINVADPSMMGAAVSEAAIEALRLVQADKADKEDKEKEMSQVQLRVQVSEDSETKASAKGIRWSKVGAKSRKEKVVELL